MSLQSQAKGVVRLLQPTSVSVLGSFLVAVAMVGGVFLATAMRSSLFRDAFPSLKDDSPEFYAAYSALSAQINSSDIAGSLSVFLVWATVGLVVYYAAVGVVALFTNAMHFLQHLSIAGVDKALEWRDVLLGLLVRMAAVAGMALSVQLFASTVLPYVLVLAHGAVTQSLPQMLLQLLAACVLIVLSAHIFIVLTRMFLLRVRVIFTRNSFTYR